MARRAVLVAGLALSARPATALDPGVSSGQYERDGERVTFTHAVALSVDNVEGLSTRKAEMRVLLSDRETPVSTIIGLAFPPVWRMARAGAIRGLLLEFDPADRNSLNVLVLNKPPEGYSLASLSVHNSGGLWDRLEISATRISGTLKTEASEALVIVFSAPVFTNPVIADLTGVQAQASEPVRVVLARAEALVRGDLAAVAALSTETSAAGLTALPPEILKLAKAEMPRLTRRLKSVKRVVIRRESATVMIGPGEWASLVLVNGAWKVAD